MLFDEEKTKAVVLEDRFSKINASCCLANIIELFNNNDNSQQESKVFCGKNFIVVDMDMLEDCFSKVYNKRKKRKSMDLAFVISDDDNIYETVISELRLNYKNVANLRLDSLKQKDKTSTRQAKLFGLPVYSERYFIFKSDLKHQAINRLNRMVPECPSYYKIKTPQELYDSFFS